MNDGIIGISLIVFYLTLFTGWVMNIVALFNTDYAVLTGETTVRILGVFVAPLGTFMGLFI